MERCSYFIKDKALFGSYPTQSGIEELEKEGVRYFIDLTQHNEDKIVRYTTNYSYINYPIEDQSTPTNWRSFSKFLVYVADIIEKLHEKTLVYVHCRGGHGRAGVVVASLLCYIFDMEPKEALAITSECHSRRSVMREKWRKIGSPQTKSQKLFIYKFFEPIKFNRLYRFGISDLPNASEDILYNFLRNKFNTYSHLKFNLMNTGLRPIVYVSYYNNFLGVNSEEKGKNILGKILMKIRYNYLFE
jgi:protein-tyrosine phosphatase